MSFYIMVILIIDIIYYKSIFSKSSEIKRNYNWFVAWIITVLILSILLSVHKLENTDKNKTSLSNNTESNSQILDKRNKFTRSI